MERGRDADLLLLTSVDGIESDTLSLLDSTSRAGPRGNAFEKITVKGDTDTEE